MPKANRAPRCTFKESGRRCPRDGQGNPPLCAPHRIAVAHAAIPKSPVEVIADAAFNFLQGKPINRDATLGAVEDIASQWAGMGADYRPDAFDGAGEDQTHRRAQAGAGSATPWWVAHMQNVANGRTGARRQAAPAPPPDPRVGERREARQTMGFSPSDQLTEDIVKERKKLLARKHHPDRGGSVERMSAINAAADVLLESMYDSGS